MSTALTSRCIETRAGYIIYIHTRTQSLIAVIDVHRDNSSKNPILVITRQNWAWLFDKLHATASPAAQRNLGGLLYAQIRV